MQQNDYNKDNLVDKMAEEKPGSHIREDIPSEKMSFDQLCECMTRFFNDRQYEHKQAFKKGFNCVVGEDYSNIDLLCNLNDIVYNHCNDENLSKKDKVHFKNLCNGIQNITKSMEQYDLSTTMQRTLISMLMGYILKITRNYFHDRH